MCLRARKTTLFTNIYFSQHLVESTQDVNTLTWFYLFGLVPVTKPMAEPRPPPLTPGERNQLSFPLVHFVEYRTHFSCHSAVTNLPKLRSPLPSNPGSSHVESTSDEHVQ